MTQRAWTASVVNDRFMANGSLRIDGSQPPSAACRQLAAPPLGRRTVTAVALVCGLLLSLLGFASASPTAATVSYSSVATFNQQTSFTGTTDPFKRIFVSPNEFYNYGLADYSNTLFQGRNSAIDEIALPTNSNPYSLAFAPNSSFAYVTNENLDTVSKINSGFPSTVSTSISVGDKPRGIVLGTTPSSSGTVYAFVANFGDDTVSVIDTDTETTVTTISSGLSGPEALTMNADGSKLYVGNRGDASTTATTYISVINTSDFSVTNYDFPADLTTTFGTSPSPTWLLLSPDESQLYFVNQDTTVTNEWETEVFALSTSDFSQQAQLMAQSSTFTTFGNHMTQLGLSKDGKLLAAGDGNGTDYRFSVYWVASLKSADEPVAPAVSTATLDWVRGITGISDAGSQKTRFLMGDGDDLSIYGVNSSSNTGPAITSVSPSSGDATGGTQITILGTGLTASTTVTVGSSVCAPVTVVGGGIQCTTAEGENGLTNVVVRNTSGTQSLRGSAIAVDAFTYGEPAPAITAISPTAGPLAGGNTITITGTALTGSTVTVGGQACTGVTVAPDGLSLTCTVPGPHVAGAVDVVVTSPAGSGTSTNGYTYAAAPSGVTLSPTNGPLTGGGTLEITGTDIATATAVTIGGATCANVAWNVGTSKLTCTIPAGSSAGATDVVITAAGGTTTITGGYTYNPAPTVTEIDPDYGPLAGGGTVTITGANLTGATVTIGGSACTNPTVNQAGTEVTCTVPSGGQAGATNVVITTVSGGTTTVTAGYYYVGAPSAATISPTEGPIAGGQTVRISGTDLRYATSVTIGAAECTSLTWNATDSVLECATPAGTAGSQTVTITTPGGSTTTSYTYVAPPAGLALSPDNGPLVGGDTLEITGANIATATAVTIGGNPCTGLQWNAGQSKLTCVVPEGASVGAKDVVVTAVGGSTTMTGGYTYNPAPTVTLIAPDEGPMAGGNQVVITGTNFTGAAVTIAGQTCTSLTVNQAGTEITCTVPSRTGNPAGAVDVVVTVPAYGTTTVTGGYTYVLAPSAISVTPVQGPTSGGQLLKIAGTNIQEATEVTVGGNPCTPLTWNIEEAVLECTSPAGTAGPSEVVVTTTGGSTETPYTYLQAATVTSVEPESGPLAGGNRIAITGTDLTGATVTIGGVECADPQVSPNGTELSCIVPAGGSPGLVDIVVTTPDRGTITLTGGYRYSASEATHVPNVPRDAKVAGGPRAKVYKISWKSPTMTDDGRPVARYRVTIKQKGYKKLILRKGLPSSTKSYNVTRKYLLRNSMRTRGDMTTHLRYVVKIEAINAKGAGPLATTYILLKL